MNEEALTKVKKNVIECGDCWDWQGYCSQSGVPMMCMNGEHMPVRRALMGREQLEALGRGIVVTVNCNNQKCVCPDHLEVLTRTQFLARNSLRTNHQMRLAKIAAAQRAGPGAKLNFDLVAEILQSDETNIALAQRLGCDHTLISLVRRGKAWKQYGANPFAGLQQPHKVAKRGLA